MDTVIELRQYTLHPGRRDELIALFEREFIETQHAEGLHVLGIFRDAERPGRFVWWRGFDDMAARARGLAAFYGGPVWARHRDAANATMVDSSDVLLLRPLTAWPAGQCDPAPWQVLVCPLVAPPGADLRAALRAHGGCWLETEPAENDFPRLPVRSDGPHIVGLARGAIEAPPLLHQHAAGAAQTLHLIPTPRSPLR